MVDNNKSSSSLGGAAVFFRTPINGTHGQQQKYRAYPTQKMYVAAVTLVQISSFPLVVSVAHVFLSSDKTLIITQLSRQSTHVR